MTITSCAVRPALQCLLVSAALLLSSRIASSQCTLNETFEVQGLDTIQNDQFGRSVGISGSTVIVGAGSDDDNGSSSGSAYLFDTVSGLQIAKLLPNDGESGDLFGEAVAISGTTAIVGALNDDDNGTGSGSAYLFDTVTGLEVAKLLPNDGATADQFGFSVAISGSTAIVSANLDDDNGSNSGSAYLFDTVTGIQIAKLLPNDGAASDLFGIAVAISGTTAIVGALNDDDNGSFSGSAYLFDTVSGLQIAKLLPNDGAAADVFGIAVAISGTTAIVGARGDDDNGFNSGSAYLFDTVTGIQIAKLLPNDGAGSENFGVSVGISGGTAIVGANFDDDNGSASGSAYLFETSTGQQIAKLLSSELSSSDQGFGTSVAISGTDAVVGVDRNFQDAPVIEAVYFFSLVDCNANGIPDDCEQVINDCNMNGISDECELATSDCNMNGVVDECDIASGTSIDFDQNGFPDECAPDCDSDGLPDFIELFFGKAQDCNSNLIPDNCDIASGLATDLDQDGLLDGCEPDCNGNGVPDSLDLAFAASLDCDLNGVPDDCEDCDSNGIGDACDILSGAIDCNLNGLPDTCDLASGSSTDCDEDSVPDECQIGADPALDMDANGLLDACEPTGYASFCTGDGGDQAGCTDCPCTNNAPLGSGGGCLNSSGNGIELLASGSASVSLPSGDTTDLRFAVVGAPVGVLCILNSGDAVAPGGMANPCFGLNSGVQAFLFDGLRCSIINTRRQGGRMADMNGEVGAPGTAWGGEGGPPVGIALAGVAVVPGQTRYFQIINRDDPLLGCMRGLNTSQAVEVTFTP